MTDTFKNYQQLSENSQENRDYRIGISDRKSQILIFTPHGGGIERGTSELVRAIAGSNLSYYLFEGTMPTARESQNLHISSSKFDEPRCLEMIRNYQTSLAIHGCEGKPPIIYAGGKNFDLRNLLIKILQGKGYPIELGPSPFKGAFSTNICNRTAKGLGVQLEFSSGMRSELFVQWKTRIGRQTTTELFDSLVSEIRDVIM